MEVTRLLSSIIKGQRVRKETILKIKQDVLYGAPEEKDENLEEDTQGQQENIERKIQNAQSQANRILEQAAQEAKAEADQIIKQSQERIAKEAQEALAKAQEEGYAQGYEKGKLEAQSLIHESEQIIRDANAQRQEILAGVEPEVIEMIIGICGKLINEEVNFNKDTIILLIRKALSEVSDNSLEVTIKVPQDQYDYVIENKELILTNMPEPENVQIRQDANLAEGACIIETSFGSIACDIYQGFSDIKKQMRLIYNEK